jgi:glycosyltransferase involved in cell wall biosynthesis
MSRTVCVVPALDAATTLPGVLAGLRNTVPDALIVGVSDGSRDETAAIMRAACDEVVAFPQNRGKGAALRTGFATALRLGADRVLAIDSDGQHDPRCAPALLAGLARYDIVIGVRQRLGTRMPMRRRLSNALSSAAISAVAGRRLPDSQSGYRAFRREVLERVQGQGDRYEFETDLLIRAARAGFSIGGVPVPTLYGPPTHFREVRDALRVIATIWRHGRVRQARSGDSPVSGLVA